MSSLIGQTALHYRILEKLGEGGMGVVYRAEDLKLTRTVALKFLPHGLEADEPERRRFLQEARNAAVLNHPNICTVYDILEHEGQQFIVMELVDGKTLRALVPVANVERAVDYALQIAEALQEAHTHGIVHRDIKTENIMVNAKNNVKVMDFGLAELKGSLKTRRLSSTVGTLAYMAPEQMQGAGGDARSDIFSLGVVLYEMLAGRLPFKGAHEAALMYSILNEEPEPLRNHLPDAPPELDHILGKALEKDPENRYQSMREMIVDLRRLKRDSAPVARPVTPSPTAALPRSPLSRRWRFGLTRAALFITLAVLVAAAAIVGFLRPWASSPRAPGRATIVVIPFENQGDPDKSYFADGLTEEITSRLSGLSGLAVIARSSARQYRNTTKSLHQIGEELSVDYVLMGTVRWSGAGAREQRIRVNPELVKVSNGVQVWSQPIEAGFSDAFTIQADVASEVARALNVTLLSSEKESLQKKPTENAVAFDYYLKGLEYDNRGFGRDVVELAITMFRQAVDADPKFAGAYARLSRDYSASYWFFYDRTGDCLARARKAAEKALEINPTLSDGYAALGWYMYHGLLDYDHALEQFAQALKYQPNNADVYAGIAAVKRRQGKFREAITSFTTSVAADPRSVETMRQMAETYTLVREYQAADSICRSAVLLAPDAESVYETSILNTLIWTGDPARARAAFEEAIRQHVPGRTPALARLRLWIEELAGSYEGALDALRESGDRDDQFAYVPNTLMRGELEVSLGDPRKAEQFYAAAAKSLQVLHVAHPGDERYPSALGIALAGLGRRDEAVKYAQMGVTMLPVEKEAWRGTYRLSALARVYAMNGERARAIEVLQRLLSIPSEISIPLLRADPFWKPLRNSPEFQALVAGG